MRRATSEVMIDSDRGRSERRLMDVALKRSGSGNTVKRFNFTKDKPERRIFLDYNTEYEPSNLKRSTSGSLRIKKSEDRPSAIPVLRRAGSVNLKTPKSPPLHRARSKSPNMKKALSSTDITRETAKALAALDGIDGKSKSKENLFVVTTTPMSNVIDGRPTCIRCEKRYLETVTAVQTGTCDCIVCRRRYARVAVATASTKYAICGDCKRLRSENLMMGDRPDTMDNRTADQRLAFEYFINKSAGKVKCHSCPNKNIGIVGWCSTCSFCCGDCFSNHKEMDAFHHGGHMILELQAFCKRRLSTIESPLYCSRHPKDLLRFYCPLCNALICGACGHNDHKDYKPQTLEEALAIQEPALKDVFKTCRGIKTWREDDISKLEESKEKDKEDIENVMREVAKALVTLRKVELEQQKKFTSQVRVECNKADDLLKLGTMEEKLLKIPKIKKDMDKLVERNPLVPKRANYRIPPVNELVSAITPLLGIFCSQEEINNSVNPKKRDA